MILPNVGGPDDVDTQRARLARKVGEPFEFDGHPLRLGVSVGIAMLPDDGTDMNALIEHADREMYEVKRTRRRRAGARVTRDAHRVGPSGPRTHD
ncbi:diguanylate cyclase domain-containing protein [Burkholderia ambifaria]|uniref:diguanylate cyclase domain-containing protein n=1 Tax=Burkholderia ambifaria TaxID=152480 RepID=UPI001FC82788|nr:diguanylate cyclase [Burkholderia ambifaria]WDR88725.1 diguanylate cyclase [Burkholderia ambifaria]WDS01490.1 diguanylate cyclase [Burkholderia ambifaria]